MMFRKPALTALVLCLLASSPRAAEESFEGDGEVKVTGRIHNLNLLDQMLPAEILFFKIEISDHEKEIRLAGTAESGMDGGFHIALPAGLYLAQVESRGFAVARTLLKIQSLRKTVDLSVAFDYSLVDPRLILAGRVNDAEGKGVPDVTVTLNPIHASMTGIWGPDQTRTDREGRFELQSYYEGYYLLSAVSPTKGVAARVIRLTGVATQELEEPLVLIPMGP